MVYLKDDQGNYWSEKDYSCLVGPSTKDDAELMSEASAESIIAKNPKWKMEETV